MTLLNITARIRLALAATVLLAMSGCSQPAGNNGSGGTGAASADSVMTRGESVYYANCVACHLPDGAGLEGAFPPLAGSDYLENEPAKVIATVLYGNEGPITVNDVRYNGVMPGFAYLTDEEVAAVVTYINGSWGNDFPPVSPAGVAAVRPPVE